MYCKTLDIPEVKLLRPVKHEDPRGFFSEVYNRRDLADAGIAHEFVQDNLAYSQEPFTIRGIHFQTPPFVQAKLVQVVRGAIYDVAVDLRKDSPTYGQYVTAEISAANFNQILIPEGFGHGLCTLEPDTLVLYKVNAHFSLEHDTGIRWDDPQLNIPWPLQNAEPLVSAKDQVLPLLSEFDSPFTYEAPV
jgi:dTDP-4-dehydrorhamnose 3,5-epimerase